MKTRRRHGRYAVTLIETLATLAILLVLLPVILEGFNLAARVAILTRQKAEATSIALSKIDEIIATAAWNNGMMQGEEQRRQMTYHWEAEVTNWNTADTDLPEQVSQLNLHITWKYRTTDEEIVLSTLIYTPSEAVQALNQSGGVVP